MHRRVALSASPIEGECAVRHAGNRLMSPLDVATLAEHIRPRLQQPGIIRPVRLMAGSAVFSYGSVFPQERPPLFVMTRIAGVVDGRGPHHLWSD